MKKLLLLLACASLISCAHKNENVSESVSEKEVMETKKEVPTMTLEEATKDLADDMAIELCGSLHKEDSLLYYVICPEIGCNFELVKVNLEVVTNRYADTRQVLPWENNGCLVEVGGRPVILKYDEQKNVLVVKGYINSEQ